MLDYDRSVCSSVKRIIAVSDADAQTMQEMYGVTRVSSVPTGVDVAFFTPPGDTPPATDLVFLGSMDWMPNVDGAVWFVQEVLPLIKKKLPDCSLVIVGRQPTREVTNLAQREPGIPTAGTIPDGRARLRDAKRPLAP